MMVDRATSSPITETCSSTVESSLNLNRGNERKRTRDDCSSPLPSPVKRTCYNWYFKLQSDNSEETGDDTESVHSVQGYETELIRDTPDTDSNSENDSNSEVVFKVEYELEDTSDGEKTTCVERDSSSGTDDCVMAAASVAIAAAVMCDNSVDWITDGEESDNSSAASLLDTEQNHTGFDTCVQCKSKNDNTMLRYCNRCYQERKNFFPPRPKGRRKKKKEKSKNAVKSLRIRRYSGASSPELCDHDLQNSKPSASLKRTRKNSTLSPLKSKVITSSLDSGIGSSQDFYTYDSVSKEQIETRATTKRRLSTLSTETDEDEGYHTIKRMKSMVYNEDDMATTSGLKSEVSTSCNHSQTILNASTELLSVKTNTNDALLKTITVEDDNKQNGKEILKSTDSVLKNPLPEHKELCIICRNHTKNSIFLHAKIGHMCCCYECAVSTWTMRKKCPVCNGKVKNIVKVFEC